MNMHVKAPLDYPTDIPPDPDEPYNRCPFCLPIVAGLVALVGVAAGYGIWLAAGIIAALVWG